MKAYQLRMIALALTCVLVGIAVDRSVSSAGSGSDSLGKPLYVNANAAAIASSQQDNTLLYLSFDNTLAGADGETPTQASGITLQPGIAGGAAAFPVNCQLQYATQNNINFREGTFEVWAKPDWSGADGKYHHLLELRNSQGLELFKDSGNFLNLIVPLTAGRGWARFSISDWTAATWRHLVFTWSESGRFARIYVNGVKKAEATFTDSIVDSRQGSMRIGTYGQQNHFEGLMDELRIGGAAIADAEVSRRFFSKLPVTALAAELSSLHLYPTWRWWPIYSATTPLGVFQADGGAFTLVSSNPAVARVDEAGRIVAVSAGTAEITASINGQQARMNVLVKPVAKPPEITPIDPYLATPAAGHLYQMPVVILRFLPTADGQTIDPAHSPEIRGQRVSDVIGRVNRFDRRVKFMLEEGSRFRGYKDAASRPALGYKVVQYITIYEGHPPGKKSANRGGKPAYYVDYETIFNRFDIPRLINERGVKEVWVWENNIDAAYTQAYDPAINRPEFLRTGWESNMSSPTGDVSNSDRDNSDLPVYNRTYVVYGQNLTRTQAEAVHNHGHQLESILAHANFLQDRNTDLFWRKFVGQNSSGQFITGRSGWTHMPLNTTEHYDYNNNTPASSDIEDWNPDNTGQKKPVSALTFGGIAYNWPLSSPNEQIEQKTESQWYVYWMQNMPGRNNNILFGSNRTSNWWHFTGDWDAALAAGLGIHESASCAYSLSANNQMIATNGGIGAVNVTCGGGCKWIASSNESWITIANGKTGNGNGIVAFSVTANNGPQRTGTIAIAGQSFTITQASVPVASVSAASFSAGSLARESIIAAFGTGLATATQVATAIPLPTELAGTTVKVKDSAGIESLAPLFFVSSSQVNYLIPAGVASGPATITIAGGDGAVSTGAAQIVAVAPGLFTADASGRGLPAATVLRVKAGGMQISEPVARFDPATNKFVAVPIDLGPATDQVFLILYGTGIRFRGSLSDVTLAIGGVNEQALYAGAQGTFIGLDQVNVRLVRSLTGRGESDVVLKVDGQMANMVKIQIK
jgi:uncharacterized protein (TIGR03437 family)